MEETLTAVLPLPEDYGGRRRSSIERRVQQIVELVEGKNNLLVLMHKLEPVELKPPQCPIIANVNARPICEVAAIKESLVQQCTERVRWRETIEYMASDEVTKCLEIGPKNVLNGLFRRTTKKITCISVANNTQLHNAIDFISD